MFFFLAPTKEILSLYYATGIRLGDAALCERTCYCKTTLVTLNLPLNGGYHQLVSYGGTENIICWVELFLTIWVSFIHDSSLNCLLTIFKRLLLARIDEFTLLPRLFTRKYKPQTAMCVCLIFWREKKCKIVTIFEKIMCNTWNWLHILSRKCPWGRYEHIFPSQLWLKY